MNTQRMARLLAERLEGEGERAGAEISVGGLLERWVPYGVARSYLELTTKSEYDLLVLEFLADGRLTVPGDPAVAEAAAAELETPEPGLDPLEEHADVGFRLDLATISGGYRRSERAHGVGDAGRETVRSGVGEPADGGGPDDPEDAGEGDDSAAADAAEAWDPTGGVEARPTLEGDAGASAESDESGDPVDIGSDPGVGTGARSGAEGRGLEGSGKGAGGECRSCGESLPVDVDVPVRFCPTCGAARPERACPECDARLRPEWSYCPACGTRASPSGGIAESDHGGVDAGEREPE